MKALLPLLCRPLGYVIIVIALFLPFVLAMKGIITDTNLLFYKETTKLLMMLGALMILLALSKNENYETERIRVTAMRNAVFITILFIFGGMLYRIYVGDITAVDSSSFLTYLIFNVLCLEYGMKKASIDKIFKK